jgi:hypothetical protein
MNSMVWVVASSNYRGRLLLNRGREAKLWPP